MDALAAALRGAQRPRSGDATAARVKRFRAYHFTGVDHLLRSAEEGAALRDAADAAACAARPVSDFKSVFWSKDRWHWKIWVQGTQLYGWATTAEGAARARDAAALHADPDFPVEALAFITGEDGKEQRNLAQVARSTGYEVQQAIASGALLPACLCECSNPECDAGATRYVPVDDGEGGEVLEACCGAWCIVRS